MSILQRMNRFNQVASWSLRFCDSGVISNLTALSGQVYKALIKTKSNLQSRQSKSERPLLDVLFPKVRAEILRLLFSTPPKQRYVRELMNMSGLALSTIQDELRKLRAVGILGSWSNRYHRFYRANSDHPFFPHLLRMVELSARLPRTKHSELHPQKRSRLRKKASRGRAAALPTSRAVKWRLFSRSRAPKNLTA